MTVVMSVMRGAGFWLGATAIVAIGCTRLTAQTTAAAAGGVVVRHDSFDDFARGRFGDGGTNTYVSADGTIQLVRRWDIDGDGHMDLLFNQDHDHLENVDAFIYWATPAGYHSLFPAFWRDRPAFKFIRAVDESRKHITFLPTFGGGPVKAVDLNRDGHLDLVFVNTIHNYMVYMEAYIYWGGPDGYSARRRTELPTLFSKDFAVSDLNRDGWLDLVFANFGNETGHRWGYKNHLASYIYWGSAQGFSIERRASIPTVSAVSCAAGDFNGDSWPDLAFANSNNDQKSLYVYLGAQEGFDPERRLELKGGYRRVLRSGDVNDDGIDDLVVCGGGASIHFGAAAFSLDKPTALAAPGPRDVAIADFNRDGHADLVFASQAAAPARKRLADQPAEGAPVASVSSVYFGSEAGFDDRNKVDLPTYWPEAVAADDLNGDGYPDIVFANKHDNVTYDVPSYVYWGSANGFDPARRKQIQGFGTVGVTAADLDGNGQAEIVLMNQVSGRLGKIRSAIYWGNTANRYSEADVTLLPAANPYYSAIADLNDDGFPDIVFTGGSLYIYYGSADGLKPARELPFNGPCVTVGDFNRDGRLDLALLKVLPGAKIKKAALIVWAAKDGFSEDNTTEFPLEANRTAGISTADLNRDGYLDLVFPAGESDNRRSQIMWGSAEGFGTTQSTLLETSGVAGAAIADLDGNGWLDLVFPGSSDLDNQDPHTKTLIFLNSKDGFAGKPAAELEAFTSLEIGVADLNRDGHLDIVSGNYKAERTRSLPLFVYWGNAEHRYSDGNRTELPAESSCGMQVLDLNGDGYPEIVAHNHIKDGDHTFGAYIYWGGKDGYSIARRTHLPTVGTHFAMGVSPGNIYDRGPEHDYVSAPVTIPAGSKRAMLTFEGDSPHNTAIHFVLRAAADQSKLEAAAWSSIEPAKPWALPRGAGLLQYRATLVSPDGGNSPLLRAVVLSFK